jgi:acyl-CoA thioesterase
MTTPRAIDRELLGLTWDEDPRHSSFVQVPELCRLDGKLYGGTAIAVSLLAMEVATGKEARWVTTQFVSTADVGDRLDCFVDVVARGRAIDQVQVRGMLRDELVFSALGSTALPRPGGLESHPLTMPKVAAPEEGTEWVPARPQLPDVGHHLVSERREVPILDGPPDKRMAMWTRLTNLPSVGETSAAVIAFLADMVPLAVTRSTGQVGAGTSLDNSLRIGTLVDTEWMLLELMPHIAVDGYGHGEVHVWAPDGTLMATGSQTAKLFAMQMPPPV